MGHINHGIIMVHVRYLMKLYETKIMAESTSFPKGFIPPMIAIHCFFGSFMREAMLKMALSRNPHIKGSISIRCRISWSEVKKHGGVLLRDGTKSSEHLT